MIPKGFEERTVYLKFSHLCEVGHDVPISAAARLLDIYLPWQVTEGESGKQEANLPPIYPVRLPDAHPGRLTRFVRFMVRGIRARA